VGNYIADYSKIKGMLGWSPLQSIEGGLKETFEYYSKFKQYYW
jgi:nucleoside-diphosphate-sugar epimerase